MNDDETDDKSPSFPAAFLAHCDLDTEAITDGVWAEDAELGMDFKLARPHKSNPAWTKAIREAMKPYAHLDDIDEELDRAIRMEAAAKAVVLDWRRRDGKPCPPCTPETVLDTLKKYGGLFDRIEAITSKLAMWRRQERARDAKNS